MITALTAIAALSPVTAFAAPPDAVSTSNFTVTVVEPTIGLNIYGNTTISELISRTDVEGYQTVDFDRIGIENSGNISGKLYMTVKPMTGIDFGNVEGSLDSIALVAGNGSKHQVSVTDQEDALATFITHLDVDGDGPNLGPGERLKDFDLQMKANGQFPIGEIIVPIQWTMKAN